MYRTTHRDFVERAARIVAGIDTDADTYHWADQFLDGTLPAFNDPEWHDGVLRAAGYQILGILANTPVEPDPPARFDVDRVILAIPGTTYAELRQNTRGGWHCDSLVFTPAGPDAGRFDNALATVHDYYRENHDGTILARDVAAHLGLNDTDGAAWKTIQHRLALNPTLAWEE